VLDEACAERVEQYGALERLLSKLAACVRSAQEHARELVSAPRLSSASFSEERLRALTATMGPWGAEELLEFDRHCLALTSLAMRVNTRFTNALGGNFPILAWGADVYEFDPSASKATGGAKGESRRALAAENQQLLIYSVVVLRHMVKNGACSLAQSEADVDLDDPALSASEPKSERSGGATTNGSKKKGKNRKR
jgi:hypothetical protein